MFFCEIYDPLACLSKAFSSIAGAIAHVYKIIYGFSILYAAHTMHVKCLQ